MFKIVCFGEVLWDVFPSHKKIGGAPLNVAVRLKSFKNEVAMISAVGNDELGKLILDYLEEYQMDRAHIQ
ncbi:MAG: fructokinase, partial [Maribacter sp.]